MLAYCLNKDINGQKLLEDIQKLIVTKTQDDSSTESLVLVIDIKKITNSTNSLIPKLEYKKLDH